MFGKINQWALIEEVDIILLRFPVLVSLPESLLIAWGPHTWLKKQSNLQQKMLEALLATPPVRYPLFKPRRSLLRRLRGRPLLAVRDLTRKCYSISLNTCVLRYHHHLYDFAFIITSSKSFCFQVYNTGRLFIDSSFRLFYFVLSSLRCSGLQPNHIGRKIENRGATKNRLEAPC